MKVVQTFWSGNREQILQNAFGWHGAAYHIQSWALSCQLLRRLYEKVELYTDETGYNFLVKQLKLPYTKVHVVLDDLNHYDTSVWALSKIRTYSLQTSPFIHVDGDVFLWKKFSDELLKSDLIIQNREIGNRYFESSWEILESKLDFIPSEILNHRQNEPAVNVHNFGIFGGKDLDFIQEYSKKAFEFVDKNLAVLDSIQEFNFNIFFEQYLFYCMSQGREVSSYFDRDFIPDQYKGLASFEDVPNTRSYLHLLGDFKSNPQVCCNMSRQLSIEFPEQYLSCLQLFNSLEQRIFNIQNNKEILDQNLLTSSFSSFYQPIPFHQKFSHSRKMVELYFRGFTNPPNSQMESIEALEKIVTKVDDESVRSMFQYELQIDGYLSSLNELNLTEYSRHEYHQKKHYSSFIALYNQFEFKQTSSHTMIKKVIYAVTSTATNKVTPMEVSRLIVPSVKAPFYHEITLDDLEEAILSESHTSLTIDQLLKAMEKYFHKDDLVNNYTNYQRLIYNSVKRLSYQRALDFQLVENEILSRRIDTNLECL
jgi:hypothetical protein